MPVAIRRAVKRKPDALEQFEKWYAYYLYMRRGIPGIGGGIIKDFMLDAYYQGRKDARNNEV